MATIVKGSCPCGWTSQFAVGRGQFDEFDGFPFYCRNKGSFELLDLNLSAEQLRCRSCGSTDVLPYGEPPVSQPVGEQFVATCGPARLTVERHICPRCKTFTMRFETTRSV